MFVNLSVIKSPELSLTKTKMKDSIRVFNELAESTTAFPIRIVVPWEYMCSTEIEAYMVLLDAAGWVVVHTDKDMTAKHVVYFIAPKTDHILEQVRKDADEPK